MAITIRPALEGESPVVARFIMEAMNEECCRWFAGPRHTLDDFWVMMTRLVSRTDSQYSYLNTLVADDAGAVVGACVSYDGGRLRELRRAFVQEAQATFGIDYSNIDDETQAGELYCDSLCVQAAYRCRGIASQLLEAVKRRACAMGLCRVGLLVDMGNPEAERLYGRLGFRVVDVAEWGGHAMRHMVCDV